MHGRLYLAKVGAERRTQARLVLGDDLRQLLQQARCGSEPADVRHLLVDLGLWPRHHLPSLQGTSWQQGFSAELLAEADALVARAEDPVAGDAQRRDLSALPTVTIDDDSTLDIDDGLSMEMGPTAWQVSSPPHQVAKHYGDMRVGERLCIAPSSDRDLACALTQRSRPPPLG